MQKPVAFIDIGLDFARNLGPRYVRLGPYSGELFRERVLEPAFRSHDMVVVRLDNISGYSASFFEEAFGGLVRKYGLAAVRRKISFETKTRPYLVNQIESWISDAEARPVGTR